MTNCEAGELVAITEASASATFPLYSRKRALAFTGPVQFARAQPVTTGRPG